MTPDNKDKCNQGCIFYGHCDRPGECDKYTPDQTEVIEELQAKIKQLEADKREALELLKEAKEFCDEVQSPRSAAIYRSDLIKSYLSIQEQGD